MCLLFQFSEYDASPQVRILDLDDMTENEVLDLDVSITYNQSDEIPGLVENIADMPAYGEKELNLDASTVYSGVHVGTVSGEPVTTDTSVNNFSNKDQNNETHTEPVPLDSNNDNFSFEGQNNELPTPCSSLSLNNGTNVTPNVINTPSPTSSGSSVEDILNSIVRFKERDSDSDSDAAPKRRTVAKKLKLPSVMTSKGWINLKTAVEKEKEDLELKRKEKKKQIALRREVQKILFIYVLTYPPTYIFFIFFCYFRNTLKK